ncbi:alpha/beta hydrolase fold domain-containing protein [Amycolatopsis acidiphila]|nr:alpha/beta hydrolase fold domain-containing protein [Amycolatopsis acidiphila]UIJ59105.1 alpha/beta hydrolase fold domain-containing protein [Amycolatopsis acidiphila]GHG98141.1 hypothetical protein GCM10017788_78040 [Amycolatopsis acidiphila]
MAANPLPADVRVTTGVLGDVRTAEITVAGVDARHVVLYFHGGVYALGDAATAADLAAQIARRTSAEAISVEYRLAPEHPYPAAVDDAFAVYQALLDDRVAPSEIVTAGESAGGGLAIATLVNARERGLPMPAAAYVLSPWANLTLSGSTLDSKKDVDPLLDRTSLQAAVVDYVSGKDSASGLISPVFADLSGLPPLIVQASTHEVLLDDAIRLARTAALADVDVTLDITAGVPHVFQSFYPVLDEAVAALDRAGRLLSGHLGVEGWSFTDVLPMFKLLENTPTGADAYHGRTGPLSIRQRADEELTPSLRGFVEASVAHGFPRVRDFNGADANGADGYPVDVVDGVRQNVGLAYLTAEVRQRQNLTILGEVNVDRVLFDGTTATGVLTADGTEYRGREVILSGGTYGSAAILLRSGIGPADHLSDMDIKVIADLPVGQRLQDQPGYYNAYALAPEYLDMDPAVGSLLWTASSQAAAGELDLHVTATHLMDGSLSPTGGAIVLMAALTRPESTGTVTLASRDPDDPSLIDPNYLGTERDAARMLEGVKLGRAIARNSEFAKFVAAELTPGEAVTDDDALAEGIAANVAVYGHPTSTVPMGGAGDPWAVVDSVGAVKGVAGLRVVDASIIPEVPSSTTNVTVIMLAERIFQRVYAG